MSVEHLWNLSNAGSQPEEEEQAVMEKTESQKGLPGDLPAVVWILTEMCHSGRWCIVTVTPRDR